MLIISRLPSIERSSLSHYILPTWSERYDNAQSIIFRIFPVIRNVGSEFTASCGSFQQGLGQDLLCLNLEKNADLGSRTSVPSPSSWTY